CNPKCTTCGFINSHQWRTAHKQLFIMANCLCGIIFFRCALA
ncbi:Ditrans,polycis-undecaprenyl-diphosphate synthase ((2E,6E)-farnesyl-diphosphate specific), partial [Haemophilus influenzae]